MYRSYRIFLKAERGRALTKYHSERKTLEAWVLPVCMALNVNIVNEKKKKKVNSSITFYFTGFRVCLRSPEVELG